MLNTDLYKVKKGIDLCRDAVNVADINFAYIMAKIESEVVAELRVIEKARKQVSPEYEKYIMESEQLEVEYAVQNQDGTFAMHGNKLLIKNPKEYSVKLKSLKDRYKDEISKKEKEDKEFEEFLLKENSVIITKLPLSLIPAQLTVDQLKHLFPVIEK